MSSSAIRAKQCSCRRRHGWARVRPLVVPAAYVQSISGYLRKPCTYVLPTPTRLRRAAERHGLDLAPVLVLAVAGCPIFAAISSVAAVSEMEPYRRL